MDSPYRIHLAASDRVYGPWPYLVVEGQLEVAHEARGLLRERLVAAVRRRREPARLQDQRGVHEESALLYVLSHTTPYKPPYK